uniref:tRNA sulfurtransferase n=1 Tax=Lygus hesperus TaxID=30085 RepID=A0A0A9Z672_LYGHE
MVSSAQELEAAIEYFRESGEKSPYTLYVDTVKLHQRRTATAAVAQPPADGEQVAGKSGSVENIPFVGSADSLVGVIRKSLASETLLPSIIQGINQDLQNSEHSTGILNHVFEKVFKCEAHVDEKVVAMSSAFVANVSPVLDEAITKHGE